MPEKFIVPQFIDTEDKILGPITVRQFLILLGGAFAIFIEYKIYTVVQSLFVSILVVLLALLTLVGCGAFGFIKINGQPFHVFFVNFLQTYTRPFLRVWDKNLSNSELRVLIAKKEKIAPIVTPTKQRPESTRLRDLALTVNTGGVYTVEDET